MEQHNEQDANNIQQHQLQQIEFPRSQFEELKFLITSVGTQINSRIDTLEYKITGDINALRNEDRRLSALIDTNNIAQESEITNLKNQLDHQNEENRRRETSLHETNEQVKFLTTKLSNLEKASFASQQHGRGWNVEIDGIPINIGDEPGQLQLAAIAIFDAINVNIAPSAIDTIHRLPSSRGDEPKPVIIRFRSRKDVRDIHENKSKLRNLSELNIQMAGLDGNSRIYIRPSLCSYYKNLSYNCRLLKRNGLIERVNTANDGKISIKTMDGSYLRITHESDLTTRFPRFQRFSFNADHQ